MSRPESRSRTGSWTDRLMWVTFLGVLVWVVVTAWGTFRGAQRKAWEGDHGDRLNGATSAELAYFAEHRDYVACGGRVTAIAAARAPEPRLGAAPRGKRPNLRLPDAGAGTQDYAGHTEHTFLVGLR